MIKVNMPTIVFVKITAKRFKLIPYINQITQLNAAITKVSNDIPLVSFVFHV
jgi:hypothetical protein